VKILEVTKCVSFIVKTDEKEFPTFRRSQCGTVWQNQMGEFWESVYSGEAELEAAYQVWLATV